MAGADTFHGALLSHDVPASTVELGLTTVKYLLTRLAVAGRGVRRFVMLVLRGPAPRRGAWLATATQRVAFSRALQRVRRDADLSQGALARALRVSRSAVSQWELSLTAPRPATTTRLEHLLGLEPGTLGRLLGQVPTDTTKPASVSVSEAIEADPRLGRRERELLLAMYRQLVKQREAGAASG